MVNVGFGVVVEILIALIILGALFFVLKAFLPKNATGWTKLAARTGIVISTVLTTLRIITCYVPGGVVQVDLQFAPFWPRLPETVNHWNNDGAIEVTGGGFTTASVSVWHADLASRIWLSIGWLIWGLLVIALCIAADRLAQAVKDGGEFRQISGNWLKRLAWVVVIGGHIAKWTTDIGQNLIAMQLQNQNFGASADATIKNPWVNGINTNFNHVYGIAQPSAGIYFNIELWLVLVGIGLYVLARVFESGRKFEQDADGLV